VITAATRPLRPSACPAARPAATAARPPVGLRAPSPLAPSSGRRPPARRARGIAPLFALGLLAATAGVAVAQDAPRATFRVERGEPHVGLKMHNKLIIRQRTLKKHK
jgi:hypothetical protein